VSGDADRLGFSVTDMNGKEVYQEQMGRVSHGLHRSIDLSPLAKGMYFARLDNGTSSLTRKLVIQ